MKCQILFPMKDNTNIISLSSAESAHNVVSSQLSAPMPLPMGGFLMTISRIGGGGGESV